MIKRNKIKGTHITTLNETEGMKEEKHLLGNIFPFCLARETYKGDNKSKHEKSVVLSCHSYVNWRKLVETSMFNSM